MAKLIKQPKMILASQNWSFQYLIIVIFLRRANIGLKLGPDPCLGTFYTNIYVQKSVFKPVWVSV
jgi:hypothetical protein